MIEFLGNKVLSDFLIRNNYGADLVGAKPPQAIKLTKYNCLSIYK